MVVWAVTFRNARGKRDFFLYEDLDDAEEAAVDLIEGEVHARGVISSRKPLEQEADNA